VPKVVVARVTAKKLTKKGPPFQSFGESASRTRFGGERDKKHEVNDQKGKKD